MLSQREACALQGPLTWSTEVCLGMARALCWCAALYQLPSPDLPQASPFPAWLYSNALHCIMSSSYHAIMLSYVTMLCHVIHVISSCMLCHHIASCHHAILLLLARSYPQYILTCATLYLTRPQLDKWTAAELPFAFCAKCLCRPTSRSSLQPPAALLRLATNMLGQIPQITEDQRLQEQLL